MLKNDLAERFYVFLVAKVINIFEEKGANI